MWINFIFGINLFLNNMKTLEEKKSNKEKKYIAIKQEDIEGNYDLNISIKDTYPMSNLCPYCRKCIECEHPYSSCPSLSFTDNL